MTILNPLKWRTQRNIGFWHLSGIGTLTSIEESIKAPFFLSQSISLSSFFPISFNVSIARAENDTNELPNIESTVQPQLNGSNYFQHYLPSYHLKSPNKEWVLQKNSRIVFSFPGIRKASASTLVLRGRPFNNAKRRYWEKKKQNKI